MHGRLKVKTTAEQQEEKRKEREKKAKSFSHGMKQVFENRGLEEKNEENMKLTEKLLSGNPDVYTLWNIRKEIFVDMQKMMDIDKYLHEELKFLQNCLHVNPKSYGVWNQRRFIMTNMKDPNWEEELYLCNLFLKYDERNFHCWDYRRFVVEKANVSPSEELDFTFKKITDNFSNYSAWHNRSKLLPLVHPDDEEMGRVDETTLLKEFQLAQNAFFTDPNDQSAWFYQRWLLGRRQPKPCLLSLSLHQSPLCVVASFSHPVNLMLPNSSAFLLDGEHIEMKWKPSETLVNHIDVDSSCVWLSYLPSTSGDIRITFSFPNINTCPQNLELKLMEDQSSNHLSWVTDQLTLDSSEVNMFSDNHTLAKSSVLEGELESLKMLLEEEPENKWTMLTIVYLMRSIDGMKFKNETDALLFELMKVDKMRAGYYKDLRSKYRIENELQRLRLEKNPIEDIDMTGWDLTSFYYGQYLITCNTLNLSNNQLSNVSFISSLLGVKNLVLSGNPLLNGQVVRELVSNFPIQLDLSV